MHTQQNQTSILQDSKLNVRLTLSALWISFMFLYIYVDYFHLYMPGSLSDILSNKAFVFEISPAMILVGLVSVTLPAMMIFLSLILPAQLSRCVNIVMVAIYIPYSLFNLAGEAWIHMYFGAIVEIILLLLILFYAWNWPRKSA